MAGHFFYLCILVLTYKPRRDNQQDFFINDLLICPTLLQNLHECPKQAPTLEYGLFIFSHTKALEKLSLLYGPSKLPLDVGNRNSDTMMLSSSVLFPIICFCRCRMVNHKISNWCLLGCSFFSVLHIF